MDNQLVDRDGEPVRLLGVNRSGAEYACVGGHGFFRWADRQASRRRHDCLGDQRGARSAERTLLAGNQRRSHRVQPSPLPQGESGPTWLASTGQASTSSWTCIGAPRGCSGRQQQPMADLDHAPDFWSSVARAFKNDPALVFDLYNEPHGISWECWRDGCMLPGGWRTAGMQTLVDAVRSSGARQPIIATGMHWGTDLSSWLEYRPDDPADQLAAGLHFYDFASVHVGGLLEKDGRSGRA